MPINLDFVNKPENNSSEDSSSPRSSRTILITGATGFIGARLAALALARGYNVKTLSRSDWDSSPAVPVNNRFFGSLPGQIPTEAFQGVDVVVHCAASIEVTEASANAVNVAGTLLLANLAQQAGVETFVFLSSQSARSDAISAYGRSKFAAEKALQDLKGINVLIIRPGLVTGSGSRGLFQRMSSMVVSLPMIPLLGGNSIVQPIHVDDLCEAIFRSDERASTLQGRILHLGDSTGVSLRQFLQAIAVAQLGRGKFVLPIPIGPVQVAVELVEKLGVPLPINSGNLKGLKIVERMETEADLACLGLTLRSVEEMVSSSSALVNDSIPLGERPVRVLLVGAGRIGIVHALTLSRLHGVVLCGIADPNKRATGLLKGMGITAPVFSNLDDALSSTNPDAAVIATPAATHLKLARTCLQRGMAVMIEKPLAVQQDQLSDFKLLGEEFPNSPVQVGYVMARNPQVNGLIDKLHSGDFGKVIGFIGVTLLSLIQQTDTQRWEVKKSQSGGGALINAGGHVLSMIHAAFGDPLRTEAETLSLYSSEVEDSVVLNLEYPQFRGQHYCSWSINGYPRQENRLIILTELGQVILTTSVGVFISNEGDIDVTHQLDFNVGFNLAPDYAGAGFSRELIDLKESVLTRNPAPMNLEKAIQIEQLLFKIYGQARETKSFQTNENYVSLPPVSAKLKLSSQGLPVGDNARGINRILDLRDLSVDDINTSLGNPTSRSVWNEYLLLPGQLSNLRKHSVTDDQLSVTVPDFFNQSRLLSTARYAEVLKQMGAGGLVMAIRSAVPVLTKERAPNFWVAAMGLVGAGLSAIPAGFKGTLLLHVYLTDLALTLRRFDILEKMLAACRLRCPHARLGFHTNMVAEALNALGVLGQQVEVVSALASPRALDTAKAFATMRKGEASGRLKLIAEVGLAPDVVHRAALEVPESWAHGADALVIGPGADASLAEQRRERLEREWVTVFPGLGLPAGVI